MLRFFSVYAAIRLLVLSFSLAYSVVASSNYIGLMKQAESLPDEFYEHFFDVPLAVKVLLDGEVLGEAMVVLSREEKITLLDFTDTHESDISFEERDKWQDLMRSGLSLGACKVKCNSGLIAVDYSLENSELSLLTNNAELDTRVSGYYTLPENGSTGLMLRNQLNLSGGQGQGLSGRYGLEALASVGNWTQTLNAQLTQLREPEDKLQYSVYELHAQKEWENNFLRIGYFTPTSIGLNRQPRSFGLGPDTTLGMMLGSSDSLAKETSKASLYPIYVTATREAVAEIYRNGALINAQQVKSGLQVLDSKPLPGGIYDVEVRLIEDGVVTSRSDEVIYKPANWKNPAERWRYNVFLGRDSKMLTNWEEHDEGDLSAGAAVNYLVQPRAVIGLSTRQVKGQNQLGASLDFGLGDTTNVYASVHQAQGRGVGMDIQALYSYGSGNVILSHNRSWLDNRGTWEALRDGSYVRQRNIYAGNVSNTSLSVSHRLGIHNSVNARLSHSEGYIGGVGLDLGWSRNANLFGHDSNWRLSVFDRPGAVSTGNQRNRGIDLALNIALASEGKSITGSAGSRTSRGGGHDRNASLGYQENFLNGPIRSVNADVVSDTYGTGLSGAARFDSALAIGDLQIQRSSYNRTLFGSLNLNSDLVLGSNKVILTGQQMGGDAGLIIDVESDIDDIQFRADDLSGSSALLKPGRNVLPVTAYREGTVQFDFQGTDAPAANIQPSHARYHLNKGGVSYQKVSVMKTMSVLGRLIDARGNPLKGHHIVNHASRGVTEVDGFFSMELSVKTPILSVLRGDAVMCTFVLDPKKFPTEGELLMIGDLRCVEGNGEGHLAAQ